MLVHPHSCSSSNMQEPSKRDEQKPQQADVAVALGVSVRRLPGLRDTTGGPDEGVAQAFTPQPLYSWQHGECFRETPATRQQVSCHRDWSPGGTTPGPCGPGAPDPSLGYRANWELTGRGQAVQAITLGSLVFWSAPHRLAPVELRPKSWECTGGSGCLDRSSTSPQVVL